MSWSKVDQQEGILDDIFCDEISYFLVHDFSLDCQCCSKYLGGRQFTFIKILVQSVSNKTFLSTTSLKIEFLINTATSNFEL